MPVRRIVTPATRGSPACAMPPRPVLRSRSSNTVPASDERCTTSVPVPTFRLPGVSMPPVLAGLLSTVALFDWLPPAGYVSTRDGIVTTAWPPLSSWPSAQDTSRVPLL